MATGSLGNVALEDEKKENLENKLYNVPMSRFAKFGQVVDSGLLGAIPGGGLMGYFGLLQGLIGAITGFSIMAYLSYKRLNSSK